MRTKLTTLLILLMLPIFGYCEDQLYFRIAVDDKDYSTFLVEKFRREQSRLHMLALSLENPFFNTERFNTKYYDISITKGLKYNNRPVTQYEIMPKFKDRFKHIVTVDDEDKTAVRREVYDVDNKLIYSYGNANYVKVIRKSKKTTGKNDLFTEKNAVYKGFVPVLQKVLQDGTKQAFFSDGLNKFSIFIKSGFDKDINQKRIINGNYVFRKKKDNSLYTVVGTVPFEQMEQIIENVDKLEVE